MKRAGVIGWPVAHSLSPVLHGYWLKEYGIDGSYEKIPAAPEDFAATIQRLRDEGYSGVNVTVPHKEAAFELAQDRDIPALISGAVNLLEFSSTGRIEGRNTDGIGLARSLNSELGESLLGKVVTIVGAGGAARGAVWALVTMGAEVRVINRHKERADRLVEKIRSHVPGALLFSIDWQDWDSTAKQSNLVVNTTSAGMGSNPPLNLDLSPVPLSAAICDIVYHPLETPLLKEARARGHQAIDGLGMLMHQAVPAFQAFFGTLDGRGPEVTPGLRAALVDALAKR